MLRLFDERQILARVVADPDVALLAQDPDGDVRTARARARPSDRTDAGDLGQRLGAANDLGALLLGCRILGVDIVGPAMTENLVTFLRQCPDNLRMAFSRESIRGDRRGQTVFVK